MPTRIVNQGIFMPYFIHEAPENEKTLEVRKRFKVDEETGYPEHYKWRSISRLGKTYKHADPYFTFEPEDPSREITSKVVMAALSTFAFGAVHICYNTWSGKSNWRGAWFIPFGSAFTYATLEWTREYTKRRQVNRNAIVIDYSRKHPERFEEIYRPKVREILLPYIPIR